MPNNDVTILVSGAGGFIGGMVVADLARRERLTIDGEERTIGRIVASDIEAAPLDRLREEFDKVDVMPGDLGDADMRRAIVDLAPDAIVHLAAVVSSAAEADFGLGLRVNVRALMDLLESLETVVTPPVFLFTSSIAVFATDDNSTIDEMEQPKPLSSYGTQKVIGELLVRDAARRGIVRGRTIRFPTISIRPGAPNRAASSFASGIVREPLKGEESILPVARSTRLHLAAPGTAIASVRHALSLEQDRLGDEITITLPGLSVTVEEMIEALERTAGTDATSRITERHDPAIAAIVSTWPGRVEAPRAESLGFRADSSVDDLIREHRDRGAD